MSHNVNFRQFGRSSGGWSMYCVVPSTACPLPAIPTGRGAADSSRYHAVTVQPERACPCLLCNGPGAGIYSGICCDPVNAVFFRSGVALPLS